MAQPENTVTAWADEAERRAHATEHGYTYGVLMTLAKDMRKVALPSPSPATGSPADLRAKLEGYRCPACDRAFYVQGNEEAYSCPTCGSKSIWQLVGPFTLTSQPPQTADLRAILGAIQSQCAGHADEFSQRVWNLAEKGMAALAAQPPQTADLRAQWIADHYDRHGRIERNDRYDVCACGATFWHNGAALAAQAGRTPHEETGK